MGGSSATHGLFYFSSKKAMVIHPWPFLFWEADEKDPSAALPSSFVIATYFHVRLIPQDFGCLASGHF
jgi:hypothetical protein